METFRILNRQEYYREEDAEGNITYKIIRQKKETDGETIHIGTRIDVDRILRRD